MIEPSSQYLTNSQFKYLFALTEPIVAIRELALAENHLYRLGWQRELSKGPETATLPQVAIPDFVHE